MRRSVSQLPDLYRAADIAKLASRGYKVAVCEQTEDPALAKGIVKRDVIRIVTPGTVIESSMLEEGKNNYLASIYVTGKECACAFLDVSTGEAHLDYYSDGDSDVRIINQRRKCFLTNMPRLQKVFRTS